jgi:signal transduction histidine kinase
MIPDSSITSPQIALDEFEVSLSGVQNELRLKVHDSDAGFDLKKTSNGHRLGLSSMKDRLKPAKGKLSIDSRTQTGFR